MGIDTIMINSNLILTTNSKEQRKINTNIKRVWYTLRKKTNQKTLKRYEEDVTEASVLLKETKNFEFQYENR